MSKLVEKGMQRQKARELSLNGANSALKNGMSYLDALLNNKEVSELLSSAELKELCDPRSNLGKSREIVDRIVKKYRNSGSHA